MVLRGHKSTTPVSHLYHCKEKEIRDQESQVTYSGHSSSECQNSGYKTFQALEKYFAQIK
jgi:hypothetical protein